MHVGKVIGARAVDLLRFAAKSLVSLVIVFAMFVMANVFLTARMASSPQTSVSRPNLGGNSAVASPQVARSVAGLADFPRFPGAIRSEAPHEMRFNGLRTLTDQWETTAGSVRVISYYRKQMLARGWRDVTEDLYAVSPEIRSRAYGEDSLQDSDFTLNYLDTVNTKLALRRGFWMLNLVCERHPGGLGRTVVRVVASEGAAGNPADVPFGKAQPLEAVEESGGNQYRTTIKKASGSLGSVALEKLEELKGSGWNTVFSSDPKRARGSYFCILTKGSQYGALAVHASSNGADSTITFTEVSSK